MKASWSAVASERAYATTMYVSMLKTGTTEETIPKKKVRASSFTWCGRLP